MRPIVAALLLFFQPGGKPWPGHTIDKSSSGARSLHLIDINTDGRPDVVTAWKEGGVVRVYFNPSRVDSRSEWRFVTVGQVKSPNAAIFTDLDHDLAFDVVSASSDLRIHWAPKDPDLYFEESAWTTQIIAASASVTEWSSVAAMQVDGRNGIDLVAGGEKGIGWMAAPQNPRDATGWRWHELRKADGVTSILTIDMDGDGDLDILYSDRTGVFWLENPGPAGSGSWNVHAIGSAGREVVSLDYVDSNVIAAVKPHEVHIHHRESKDGSKWRTEAVPLPESAGIVRSARLADIDQDGRLDLIYSGSCVGWMSLADRRNHDIGGAQGSNFGPIELIDLDGDQDLDVLTTESGTGLGIVWYENPGR